ncbi:MAG: CPn0927/CPn0928 family alpha/beta hydrolase fold protein [Chlamydiia bacterium]
MNPLDSPLKTTVERTGEVPSSEGLKGSPAESSIWSVLKNVVSIIFLPYGLYRLVHWVALTLIVPSASMVGVKQEDLDRARKLGVLIHSEEYNTHVSDYNQLHPISQLTRVAILVDDMIIDAMIMKPTAFTDNGRWLLQANGNYEYYEHYIAGCSSLDNMLKDLQASAILFNYPGAGASTGTATPETMQKAYRAVLSYVEDKLQAKEVIGYGHSLGGGIQATALVDHQLKKDVKYVFIQGRSFSRLSEAAAGFFSSVIGPLARGIVRGLGLEIDAAKAIKKIQQSNPETKFIIVQTGYFPSQVWAPKPTEAIYDGVITAQGALSGHVSADIPVVFCKEMHNSDFEDQTLILIKNEVNKVLQSINPPVLEPETF